MPSLSSVFAILGSTLGCCLIFLFPALMFFRFGAPSGTAAEPLTASRPSTGPGVSLPLLMSSAEPRSSVQAASGGGVPATRKYVSASLVAMGAIIAVVGTAVTLGVKPLE